jgi:hypothetical protein
MNASISSKEKQAVDFITDARNQKSNLNINGLEITIVANQKKIMVLKITYPY